VSPPSDDRDGSAATVDITIAPFFVHMCEAYREVVVTFAATLPARDLSLLRNCGTRFK
jgi:hypothetical protein